MATRAVIVGAGVGGLATAIGLRDAGWQVVVLEKWPQVVGRGAALGLWPAAQRGLDELGLGAQFQQQSVPPGRGTLYRPDGRVLLDIAADSKRIPPVRLISRRRLMALLVARADGIEIRTGVAADARAMRAALTDADLLVGADGVQSTVRQTFFGDRTKPRYSGLVAWRGSVGFEAPALGETWGGGRLFGLTPMQPGRTNFYAAVPAGEDDRSTFAELREQFRAWRTPIPEVLAAVAPEDVLRNPIFDLHPALTSYVRGRVVLLGDAAHAMTPHLGRGACEAITDAVTLVAMLRRDDIDAGLTAYDHDRRRPSQKIATRSWLMMKLVRSQRIAPVRNGLLRMANRFVS